jgi:glycosyltransferase involved in cell wall biosynthesis
MRVLFSVPRYHPNHDGMVAGLVAAGHEVGFVVREPHPAEPDRAGVAVTRVPARPARGFLRGLLGSARPDVVVGRNPTRFTGALFAACRRLGIPFLLYVQYPDGYEAIGPGRRLRLALGLWPRHTVNSAAPEPARHVRGKTYDFLPFAVEPGPGKPAYSAEAPLRLITVGKLDQARKNLAPMVRHVTPLLREGAASLTIVGFRGADPEPPYRALVEEIAARGVGERVRLVENVPHETCLRLYREHDLFLLASSRERAAISPLEAMAAGLPAVCGADNGTNYAILPGETGFVFPDRDFAGMAGLVARLCERPGEVESMGRAARRHMLASYSPGDFARRFEALVARRFGPLPSPGRLG